MHDVPEALRGLELYENDPALCAAWQGLIAAAQRAHPHLDLEREVAKAHLWELARPSRRKKDRKRFLSSWFARADERAQPSRPMHPVVRRAQDKGRVVSSDAIRERFRRRESQD